MTHEPLPILYSFRRCPYAIRTRMVLSLCGVKCELREVVLRAKPEEMIKASPKATVPVLICVNGTVLEESLDIMHWALQQADPARLLEPEFANKDQMNALIAKNDTSFKHHLDRYKYANRYESAEEVDLYRRQHREAAMQFLIELETLLKNSEYLFGSRLSLADVAISPFVRQFANTDWDWFSSQPIPNLIAWLKEIVNSELFLMCMKKFPPWQSETKGVCFPELS